MNIYLSKIIINDFHALVLASRQHMHWLIDWWSGIPMSYAYVCQKSIICVVHPCHWKKEKMSAVHITAVNVWSHVVGPVSWSARSTTWRSSPWCQSGKETGKFRVSRLLCESESVRLYFLNLVVSTCGSGTYRSCLKPDKEVDNDTTWSVVLQNL